MRAVLDTNVLVSAAIGRRSPPDIIVRAWRSNLFEVVTSPALIEELEDVLSRPRIARLIGPNADARSWVHDFRHVAVHVVPTAEVNASPDPDDNRVLEAAVEAQADFIVSGDHHLLDLREFQSIAIVTPARFVSILRLEYGLVDEA